MLEPKRKFRCRSHVFLERDMIESKAFLELTGKAAMLCLLRFHQKTYKKRVSNKKKGSKSFLITNNGEIVFTYAEAKELGICTGTFYKCLRELIEDKGFIDIATFGNPFAKQPNKYAISDRWREYGTSKFIKIKIPRQLPEGYGFRRKTNKNNFSGVK